MLEVEIEQLPSFLLGEQRGLKQGLEQGIEQGAYDKAIAVARQLLGLKFSLPDIAKITGLPVEKLAGLR